MPQGGSLQGQLVAESAARLHDPETPTLEALEAAVAPDHITFNATQQLMGTKHLALYCARAVSSNSVSVSICEYPSIDQAKRGETESNIVMNQVAGHTSIVHKKSVMHLVAPTTAPAPEVEKIKAAFNAL